MSDMNGKHRTSTMMPANDVGAEQALLGSMMRDSSIIAEAATLVRPDQFYNYAHQLIFRILTRMYAEGTGIDLVTVGSAVIADRIEEEIGGLVYLATLHESAPCQANYFQYAVAIRNAALRRNTERVAGKPDGSTVHGVIIGYFANKYKPVFRRNDAIYSGSLEREIRRSEACAGPTSDIFPALIKAEDFPRDQHGAKRAAIPEQFRKWAPSAWADIIAGLPDEADSPELSESAREKFRTAIAALFNCLVTIGVRESKDGAQRQERRSLIEWARLFAKPGTFKSVRSFKLWCKLDDDGSLQVAFHPDLFGQVDRWNPLPQRGFTTVCETYDVGQAGKTSASRWVVLTQNFLAELLEGPSGASCGANDGATHVRAHARDAPHVSPQGAPREDVHKVGQEES